MAKRFVHVNSDQSVMVFCHQTTATTMYCGLVTEMSENCPASSS